MAMNKYLSIITLKLNGLNAPFKRHRAVERIRKHEPHICCHVQETHLRKKKCIWTENEGLEKNIPSAWTGKKKPG